MFRQYLILTILLVISGAWSIQNAALTGELNQLQAEGRNLTPQKELAAKEAVEKFTGKKCKICCTRKTLPNLRLLQKYAVQLGGGINHRFNLSDEYLIKDNHIASTKNIKEIVN